MLGIIIGILLSLLIFRVLQNKWEISRLNKANANLQAQLTQANTVIDRQATAPTVEDAIYGAKTADAQDPAAIDANEGATLTKRKRI